MYLPTDHGDVSVKRINEGGWGYKTGINLFIFILSTYTGEIFGFINFEKLNPLGIMANTNLTNLKTGIR